MSSASVELAPYANTGAALALVERSLLPASQGQMEIWLAELALVTASRAQSEDSSEARLIAYTKRLAEYPGDVVRETLQGWSGKWWPTWAELKEVLDARSAGRQAIRNALLARLPRPEARAEPGPDPEARRGHITKLYWRSERLRAGKPLPEDKGVPIQDRKQVADDLDREAQEMERGA